MTRMQRISRAPELSATLSLDSCWIMPHYLAFSSDLDQPPALAARHRPRLDHPDDVAGIRLIALVVGVDRRRPADDLLVYGVAPDDLDLDGDRLVGLARDDGALANLLRARTALRRRGPFAGLVLGASAGTRCAAARTPSSARAAARSAARSSADRCGRASPVWRERSSLRCCFGRQLRLRLAIRGRGRLPQADPPGLPRQRPPRRRPAPPPRQAPRRQASSSAAGSSTRRLGPRASRLLSSALDRAAPRALLRVRGSVLIAVPCRGRSRARGRSSSAAPCRDATRAAPRCSRARRWRGGSGG